MGYETVITHIFHVESHETSCERIVRADEHFGRTNSFSSKYHLEVFQFIGLSRQLIYILKYVDIEWILSDQLTYPMSHMSVLI